jgi:glyoxalase/bleomycin resistance protein/dioxygenase superfamily protein
MLADKNAMATIAVKNLAAAKKFYEGKLRLQRGGPESAGVATYRSGDSTIVVYESQHAGTNKANAVTWGAGEQFDTVMRELKDAGIAFEHYDLPGATLAGDVHMFGSFKAAWFKDPDGNILHVNSG